MYIGEHTSRQYDAELESLRIRVLQMGELVGKQFRLAIEALFRGDLELANSVIEDDHRVNALEVAIDESCCRIIVRRQPTAIDLRMVMMAVKTITDLERIGDEAKNIAVMARRLLQKKNLTLPRFDKIQYLANLAQDMLRKSLELVAILDISDVPLVVRQDDQVDEEFRTIIRYLVTFMMEDPRSITNALEILFVAKSIERIGDHAKNMSEYVVYLVKGRDVRHTTAVEIEREVNK